MSQTPRMSQQASHVPTSSHVPSLHHISAEKLNTRITSEERVGMSRIYKTTIGDALKNPSSRLPTSNQQGRGRLAAKSNEVNRHRESRCCQGIAE